MAQYEVEAVVRRTVAKTTVEADSASQAHDMAAALSESDFVSFQEEQVYTVIDVREAGT